MVEHNRKLPRIPEDELEGYRSQIVNKVVVLARKNGEFWQSVRGMAQSLGYDPHLPGLGLVIKINSKFYNNINLDEIFIVTKEEPEKQEEKTGDEYFDYDKHVY